MLTRKINNTLLVAAHIAKFLMQMGFAVLLAKLVWWIITPAYNEVYVDKVRINQKDTSIKYIVNRYPFGEIVVIKHKDETPLFSTLVKLHGVYVNGANSMAFINYNGKSMVVKVGGNISSDITLTEVEPDTVVIAQNDDKATIKITKSDDMPSPGNSLRSNNISNSGFNNQNNYQNNNQNNYQGNQNNNQSSYQGGQNNNDSNTDLMEKRRELIDKFRQEARDTTN